MTEEDEDGPRPAPTSFTATDGRRNYFITVSMETLPDGSPGLVELRCDGKPVQRISPGVYRIKAAFSLTRQNIELTSDDPNAP